MLNINNILILIFLSIFSFSINFYFGNLGVFPIDTFAFFDTGYLILRDQIPIKDIWISTGLGVDILQSFFFSVFGVNWNSYLIHSSLMNMFACLFFYYFFLSLNINKFLVLAYCIFISSLLYPMIGTPYHYHHALIFSLIGILLLCAAIKDQKNFLWFVLPIIFLFAFLFMQTPSIYIIFLSSIIIFFNFILTKNSKNIIFLVGGIFTSVFLLFLFLYLYRIPLVEFLNQYILFPSSIGIGRILSEDSAFVALSSNLNFKSVVGHFKFFHLILIVLIYCLISCLRQSNYKKNNDIIIFLLIISSCYLFIFSQLITANQTFIFSLIPITGLFAHYGIKKYEKKNIFLNLTVVLIVSISSFKYFFEYVTDRKFIDLQSVKLSEALDANSINSKFKGLRWISHIYPNNPNKEIQIIKQSLDTIKSDEKIKMVITDYQFFSILLDEDLNNLNRWYTHDNNSYPLKDNRYFKSYENFINNKIKDNKIEVIYIIDSNAKNNINIENFKIFLPEYCFKSKQIIKGVFSKHEITKCNK